MIQKLTGSLFKGLGYDMKSKGGQGQESSNWMLAAHNLAVIIYICQKSELIINVSLIKIE